MSIASEILNSDAIQGQGGDRPEHPSGKVGGEAGRNQSDRPDSPLCQGHPDESPAAVPQLTGTVLAVQANYYRVQLDRNPYRESLSRWHSDRETALPTLSAQAPELLCTRRSRLKKIGQQVMVGDRVVVEEPDWEGGRGAIADVFPRKTQLDRPPIANADRLLLVFAIEEPTLDPHQLSRFLVKAESTGLSVALCLNKIDLVSDTERNNWQNRIESWGYQPLFISLENAIGIESLLGTLKDKITVISGPSGVGKSSLINQFIPSAEMRVSHVSGKLGRGRHTTRHVELFELPSGGLLADSPGFNQPNIDFFPKELANYFPEARQRLQQGNCQFSDCLHRDEPNCVVRGDWERYEYYLEFLEETIAYEEALSQQSNPESSMKVKSKGKGTKQEEPKLESKKYRRVSRRLQHQNLEELYQDLAEEEDREF